MKRIISIKNFTENNKMMMLADQVVVSASAFLTNILLAHQLGLEQYGFFSAITLIQIFILSLQQAAGPGIYQVLYNRFSSEVKKNYTSGLFFLEFIFIGILILFALIFYPFSGKFNVIFKEIFIPAVCSIIFFLVQDFLRKILLTQQKIKQALISDFLTNSLQLLTLAAFAYYHQLTLLTACWVIALTFIPSIIAAAFYIKPEKFSLHSLQFSWKEHKAQSGWMILSALVQWSAGNYFIVAAGWWLGATALGALRLAQYLFGLLNVLLQAIENYVLPKASQVHADQSGLQKYLKAILAKSMLYMLPLLMLLVVFAKEILRLSGGTAYEPYAFILYGLSILYIIITAGYPVKIALRVQLLNRDFFLGYLFATASSLFTAKFLITQWHIRGVLAGLFLSQLITNCYWLYILFKKNFFTWKLSTWF